MNSIRIAKILPSVLPNLRFSKFSCDFSCIQPIDIVKVVNSYNISFSIVVNGYKSSSKFISEIVNSWFTSPAEPALCNHNNNNYDVMIQKTYFPFLFLVPDEPSWVKL